MTTVVGTVVGLVTLSLDGAVLGAELEDVLRAELGAALHPVKRATNAPRANPRVANLCKNMNTVFLRLSSFRHSAPQV